MRRAALAGLAGIVALALPTAGAGTSRAPRILVFTRTAGYRHASIPAAVAAVRRIAATRGIDVDVTADARAFADSRLRRYRAVVFLLTTGSVLDGAERAALVRYVHAGGGWAGVHSAADTETSWRWYGTLVGAVFRGHPPVQAATVDIEDATHPSTVGEPRRWRRIDEWYAFRTDPRAHVHVLARVDETTYHPGSAAMGRDHPIAWCHLYQGGRAWYTAMGHTSASYAEPAFRRHLAGGIAWAAGLVSGTCS